VDFSFELEAGGKNWDRGAGQKAREASMLLTKGGGEAVEGEGGEEKVRKILLRGRKAAVMNGFS